MIYSIQGTKIKLLKLLTACPPQSYPGISRLPIQNLVTNLSLASK